jgi:bifunctional UDP-N-acetylglucosamine pyrophosphorylase/glucosamine-1-phosphate N-acetyltransferase
MIVHVLDALARAGVDHPVVVVGHGADEVEPAVADRALTVRQDPQLGTADAVRVGLQRVPGSVRHLLVTVGDAPLLPADLLRALVHEQAESAVAIAVLTATAADATGYGRVVRGSDGRVAAIVEETDADDATRRLTEINGGTYCFDAAWLRANVGRVPASASGEFYLTDLVALAVNAGRGVAAVSAPRAEVTMGINDRIQLAAAERLFREQIAERHMRAGVTIVDPASTFIGVEVELAADVRIEPWCVLEGRTRIAAEAVIGPASHVRDSLVGARSLVVRSVVEGSQVAEDVEIGPFSHLRPGSEIGAGCRIGNFAEVKQSRIGAGTQQHHFSYVGDAEVGERVNIGAGTVTVNYDGKQKHRTVIGDGAFIGSDTMLRAPISVGPGARTGAGSVVTRDVPDGKTVVGMPARPIELRRRRAPPDASATADGVPAVGEAPADTTVAT